MSLYSHPFASVLVNGTSSEPFDILNGTWQGWPLSILLFVVVIEHVARVIRQNASIQGIQTPSSHHKLSLYEDDLLVYVQQPHTSLPSLFAEFWHFSSLSNFNLNISKMEALNVSLPASTMSSLRLNYSFQWQVRGISNWGVIIPANLSNLFSLNYVPLLSRIGKELEAWEVLLYLGLYALTLLRCIYCLNCYTSFKLHTYWCPSPSLSLYVSGTYCPF